MHTPNEADRKRAEKALKKWEKQMNRKRNLAIPYLTSLFEQALAQARAEARVEGATRVRDRVATITNYCFVDAALESNAPHNVRRCTHWNAAKQEALIAAQSELTRIKKEKNK